MTGFSLANFDSLVLYQFKIKKGLRFAFFLYIRLGNHFITVQLPNHYFLQKEIKYQHLQALKGGNRESFRLVYDQYHKQIYYYCLKLIRQNTLAEEATADVFITLWKKRHIIDPKAPFIPLLYKIAKDIAYNYLKKIAAHDRLKQNFLNNFFVGHHRDGEAILIESEAMEAIQTIVEKLPTKRKEIFKLRYFEGMNNQTIAQQLNLSVNTVREQLSRARQFLREHHVLK